jgi:DNA polymerase III delta subunit
MRSSPGRSRAGKSEDASARAASGETSRPARAGSARRTSRATGKSYGRAGAGALEAIDRGEFPQSLYIEGPSEPVKAALLAELRHGWARACPESPLARVLRAAETSIEQILATFQGVSLFSPRDLVIVLEVEDLGRSDKKIQALADGLRTSTSPSTIVLVESASDTPRKSLEPLRTACAARLDALPPTLTDLVRWGERRLSREGVDPERGVVSMLAEACEGDALAFFSEIDKLAIWGSRDGRVTQADLKAMLRPAVGSELPDYLAAVAMGHAGIATQRLGRLLAAGTSEGLILFSLANLVGGALGGWSRYRDASSALRRRAHPVALGRALDAVYRAEAAWKGGRADAVAVLEKATRMVCGEG